MALVGAAIGADPDSRLAPAIESNVVELDGERIRFSHPLLASGVYGATAMRERRALHRRLAELVPDSEERARHLAHAAEGPDESVAAVLDHAALRAHSRGALPAAAELSELARRLTPTELEESRHRRMVDAAVRAWEAGEGEHAGRLLTDAGHGPGRAEARRGPLLARDDAGV